MKIADLKAQKLILFECISGSRAYGLHSEKSDTDIKGVFALSKKQFYSLDYVEQVNNESNDEVYYELKRFIDLLGKNNPNILELLATPTDCVLYRHALMQKLGMCGELNARKTHVEAQSVDIALVLFTMMIVLSFSEFPTLVCSASRLSRPSSTRRRRAYSLLAHRGPYFDSTMTTPSQRRRSFL